MRLGLIGIAALCGASLAGAQNQPAPPPSASHGAGKPPMPSENPGGWMRDGDYPVDALREGKQGVVGFRLMIGINGQVTGCTITQTSGVPSLDQATCALMTERARFYPARDRKGNAVEGSYSSRARWVIPQGKGPQELGEITTVQTFVVEADGSASNCRATRNGVEVTDVNVPTPCSTGEKFEPFKGMSGKPQRKKVTVTRTVAISDPDN